MNIDATSMAAPTLAQEAGAALLATTDQAQAANVAAVAELAEVASEAQIAEYSHQLQLLQSPVSFRPMPNSLPG